MLSESPLGTFVLLLSVGIRKCAKTLGYQSLDESIALTS
jgi:hypothetical protein